MVSNTSIETFSRPVGCVSLAGTFEARFSPASQFWSDILRYFRIKCLVFLLG